MSDDKLMSGKAQCHPQKLFLIFDLEIAYFDAIFIAKPFRYCQKLQNTHGIHYAW